MALTNHERIGKALQLLSDGLTPFVERECKANYGSEWAQSIAKTDPAPGARGRKVSPTDAQFLLKVIWDEWQIVFRNVLGQTDRTYVSELRDVRNRWAHQDTFSTDDAERALDTMRRLLLAVSASEAAVEVDKMRQELLRLRFSEQARQTQRNAAAVAQVEGQPTSGLRPWRELVTPHPDVASGRYQQAEFAADLHQVWRDEAADEYGQPVEFFRRTFLTDGLRDLLLNAVRRFRKEGGDPVVELQTNFGGGKTHSMIALYHLAAGYPPHELPGVEAMLATAGLEAPPPASTAVLVGQMISPGTVYPHDGIEVHTLWGELAWQLGGAEGYSLVAEADRTGTSPGVALVELLRRYSPCLILIDEWVAYARQLYGVDGLPAGSFDAQFTFAQALAEAARAVEGALMVVSIPASDIEVGGDGGRAALERLKNVIGRMESSWRPASAEEGFEIVRRRLFDDLPAESAPARDAVVKAFGTLYRSQRSEFPSGVGEQDYERRLAAAYPIHPELFDRLYGEWSTLDKFQRTRGVLRLMAAVVHELWERQDGNLLILPATVPIDAPPVSSELTRYLEEGWTPVIESDVDGPNALPLRLDRDNAPTLGRYSAARRVARTIYMGSAPTQQAANRGIDDRSVKLGCVQPGETPGTFGDALRRLTDQATYLYVDGPRYWFSLQPSVTRLAQDRAVSHFSDDDVDEEIRRRLAAATRANQRGDFATVHPAPRTPSEVPDEAEVRLVVLGPDYPHSGKTTDSPARLAAQRFLDQRSGGARVHRNMLVFLAPDRSRLAELRQGARDFLAWKSIEAEKETLNLDAFQSRQAETKREQFDEVVAQRISETFIWVLVPSQAPDDPTIVWEETRVSGTDPLAVRVSKKLRNEEALITEYSGARLRMDLDRVPLWRGDHVTLKQLWSDYSQYLYLPRLQDSAVLLEAVRGGVALLTWATDTFAYASAYDEGSGRYVGLAAGQQVGVVLDTTSLVVRPEVASRQLEAPPPPAGPGGGGDDSSSGDGLGSTEAGGHDERGGRDGPKAPTRFYARVTLDPLRVIRDIGDIADAVINQLGRSDATVTVTVEIEATAPEGFSEDVRRAVDENARTLKFDSHEFEG
jgi:hypothetical protein